MNERDKALEKFKHDVSVKYDQIWRGRMVGAYQRYIGSKKRGDYTYMVDEWDKFELEKQRYDMDKINDKIKGEIIMSEQRVLVRLSKNYNVVEVESSGLQTSDDFIRAKQWAFNEAYDLLKQIPDSGFSTLDDRKPTTPSTYTKETTPKKPYTPTPHKQFVKKEDIKTRFLKGGQLNVAVKKINDGQITLEQVNNLQSFEEAQALVFG